MTAAALLLVALGQAPQWQADTTSGLGSRGIRDWRLYPQVCRLEMTSNGRNFTCGTACLVSVDRQGRGCLLTAKHVIEGTSWGVATFGGGNGAKLYCWPLRVAPGADLATVWTQPARWGFGPVPIARPEDLPARGDPVTVVGCGGPDRKGFFAYGGTVGVRFTDGSREVDGAPASRGDSGGPVLEHRTGAVCAVLGATSHDACVVDGLSPGALERLLGSFPVVRGKHRTTEGSP